VVSNGAEANGLRPTSTLSRLRLGDYENGDVTTGMQLNRIGLITFTVAENQGEQWLSWPITMGLHAAEYESGERKSTA